MVQKRVIHVVVLVVAGLALAAAVLTLGTLAWLHSASGQRYILHKIETATKGKIEARRVSGSFYSDMVLEDVTMSSDSGPAPMRATRVKLRYSLISFITDHPSIAMDAILAGGGHVTARGPLDALRVDGTVDTDKGPLAFEGTVDAVGKVADVDVTSKRFSFTPSSGASSFIASVDAHVHAEADKVNARGKGHYQRRDIDPSLPPAAAEKYSEARGNGTYTLTAKGAKKGKNLVIRYQITLGFPDRPDTHVHGAVVVPPDGRPRLTADVETP